MRNLVIVKNGEYAFNGMVQYLEIEIYETSTEIRFTQNGISYSLDVNTKDGYEIIIK